MFITLDRRNLERLPSGKSAGNPDRDAARTEGAARPSARSCCLAQSLGWYASSSSNSQTQTGTRHRWNPSSISRNLSNSSLASAMISLQMNWAIKRRTSQSGPSAAGALPLEIGGNCPNEQHEQNEPQRPQRKEARGLSQAPKTPAAWRKKRRPASRPPTSSPENRPIARRGANS